MNNLTVLCVGKIKETYLNDGIAEYRKRLSKFAKVDIIEIDEAKASLNPSEGEIKQILETEGERLLSRIPKDAVVGALAIEGEMWSSEAFANAIDKASTYQSGHLVFIIGGSHGLSGTVKTRADWKLSFSKMTFPHQLMRLVLFEQLYRAFSILHHSSYHK
jgi:23S rRNA (pseudouridine1915-N3)-methyltransferase